MNNHQELFNKNLNSEKLIQMLRTQNRLNKEYSENWKDIVTPTMFKTAILVETGELLDHLNYKWWKKENPLDMNQIHLECVDILHFLLSLLILSDGDYALVSKIFEYPDDELIETFDKEKVIDSILNFNENLSKSNPLYLVIYFQKILKQLNLSYDNLYRLYISKTALNLFRWSNGYKEGTYIKNWNNMEDNEHLIKIYETIPAHVSDPVRYIVDELTKIYPQQVEK